MVTWNTQARPRELDGRIERAYRTRARQRKNDRLRRALGLAELGVAYLGVLLLIAML